MSPAPHAGARTLVMGVLNVTPDSFSDGGLWDSPAQAIEHGLALAANGADIVDVGGESTRPGADVVPPELEAARVIPVVAALAAHGVAVSIDTRNASTARLAIEAGATFVNDVSGGADAHMAAVVAAAGVDVIVMHSRGSSTDMDSLDRYHDVVAEVRSELDAAVAAFESAGVDPARIIVDPGLGFAKVAVNNWPLLARMDELANGRRVLVGASRKRFLAAAIAKEGRPVPTPVEREHATTAITTLAALHGAWAVRVHDVSAACDAIAVVSAWQNGSKATP